MGYVFAFSRSQEVTMLGCKWATIDALLIKKVFNLSLVYAGSGKVRQFHYFRQDNLGAKSIYVKDKLRLQATDMAV